MLRRSLLYIPASSQKMLTKARVLTPDTIALDLEDGVAESAKALARENLLEQFHDIQKTCQTNELAIRVNSVSALENFHLDMEMLNGLRTLPTCLLVPKVDSVQDSSYIIDSVNKIYRRRGKSGKNSTNFP